MHTRSEWIDAIAFNESLLGIIILIPSTWNHDLVAIGISAIMIFNGIMIAVKKSK